MWGLQSFSEACRLPGLQQVPQAFLAVPGCPAFIYGLALHRCTLVAPVCSSRSHAPGPGATSATRRQQCNPELPVELFKPDIDQTRPA